MIPTESGPAPSGRTERPTASIIAQKRPGRPAFGSDSPGRAAVRLSSTASASPLGVSQFSSQTTGPSSVRNTSARAMPCQCGADEHQSACCNPVTNPGSAAHSAQSSFQALAIPSAAR